MHLSELPDLSDSHLKDFIATEIFSILKRNSTNLEKIEVHSLEYFGEGADVTFHFYGIKHEEKKLKYLLIKYAERGYIGNFTITERDVHFETLLSIEDIKINQPGSIREGDEFELSCVAKGSPSIIFRWLKDEEIINVSNPISHKWTRLVRDPDVASQYAFLLGVKFAHILDQGVFTCQVEDEGFQQCLSKRVQIRRPPTVRIYPMSLTLQKGENFTVKCVCVDGNSPEKYTYSWTKNKELLPIRSSWESYEILYPGGSILQVSRINKSTTYSCLVQDGTLSTEVTLEVRVVDRMVVRTCRADTHLNVQWPETAPDTESIQDCPNKTHRGVAVRFCSLAHSHQPSWRTPDFSQCTHNDLHEVHLRFQKACLGYGGGGVEKTLRDHITCLNDRSLQKLLPGEGARILSLMHELISLNDSFEINGLKGNYTKTFYKMVDNVIFQSEALVTENQVILLQRVLKEIIFTSIPLFMKFQTIFHQAFRTFVINMSVIDTASSAFSISVSTVGYQARLEQKLQVNMEPFDYTSLGINSAVLTTVVYRNLTSFLPAKSSIRLRDGSEMEYVVVSDIAAAWLYNKTTSQEIGTRDTALTLVFRHYAKNDTLDSWNVKCAATDFATYGYSWDPHVCHTQTLNATATRCSCPRTGTFALLLTTIPQKVDRHKIATHKFVVIFGCSTCFLFTSGSAIVLIVYWVLKRSCILFLKIQCCISLSGAMSVFIVAHFKEDSEASYVYIMIFLETFLLTGMSSQLSKLLVVYTEIVQFTKPTSSKQTVIGIITGVPLITVFGNHIAQKTMNKRLKSWWIIFGSLAYYLFITCFVLLVILYVLIYFIIERKVKEIMKDQHKGFGSLQARLLLLRRSAHIFTLIVFTTTSSIFYINFSSHIWLHYEFCLLAIILGTVIFTYYVIKTETILYPDILEKIKTGQKEPLYSSYSSTPFSFFTKQEAEMESDSAPDKLREKMHLEDIQLKETPAYSSIKNPDMYPKKAIHHSKNQTKSVEEIELYSSSPKQFRKIHQTNILSDAKSSSTVVCVDLDLVVSFNTERNKISNAVCTPVITITPDENTQVSFRGSNDAPMDQSKVAEKVDDNLEGVLSSISHDLQYLLKDTPGIDESILLTPKKKHIGEKSLEISSVKIPEGLSEISRTDC